MNIIRRAIFEKVNLKKGLRVGAPYSEINIVDPSRLVTLDRHPVDLVAITPAYVYTYQTSTCIHRHAWGGNHESL